MGKGTAGELRVHGSPNICFLLLLYPFMQFVFLFVIAFNFGVYCPSTLMWKLRLMRALFLILFPTVLRFL
jgi:hypothetical protein